MQPSALTDKEISMSEHMFGVSRQKPTRANAKRIDRIARRHGAYLVEADLPGTGYQRWFAGPNLGFPFDDQMARRVFDDLTKASLHDG
jgi:hypothetical protein